MKKMFISLIGNRKNINEIEILFSLFIGTHLKIMKVLGRWVKGALSHITGGRIM